MTESFQNRHKSLQMLWHYVINGNGVDREVKTIWEEITVLRKWQRNPCQPRSLQKIPSNSYRWRLILNKHKLKGKSIPFDYVVSCMTGKASLRVCSHSDRLLFLKDWIKIPFLIWLKATVQPQATACAMNATTSTAPRISHQRSLCWFTLNCCQEPMGKYCSSLITSCQGDSWAHPH